MNNDYGLNNRLISYQKEIVSLKQKIAELEKVNSNLKFKIQKLTKNHNYFLRIEDINKRLQEDQEEKISRIKDLNNKLLKVIEDSKEESRNLRKDLESEILYYKGLNENGISKINAADKIMKLNETQHKYIIKIERKIEEIQKENEIKMGQLQIEHETNFIKLKKEMISYIKKAEYDMSKKNNEKIDLNMKFGLLYKNQLLNELENQSLQLEELLKLNEKQKKMLFALQQEIETHKQVEQILTKKNEEYHQIIKNKTFNKNKKINDIQLNIINNNSLSDRTEYKSNNLRTLSLKENTNNTSLEKTNQKLLKENFSIKNKYNTLKDKENMFQEKYKGIIKLFNDALEEILKDDEIKKRKNIYININELKNGNFEKFTKEEKYHILVLLINNLLPLIQINENETNLSSLKEKIDKIEFKVYNQHFSKINKTPKTQRIKKLIFGITSRNFNNINIIGKSERNSNERDYLESKKKIFHQSIEKNNNIKKNYLKTYLKNRYIKINEKSIYSDKTKYQTLKKEPKTSDINKGNSCDKKFERIMII